MNSPSDFFAYDPTNGVLIRRSTGKVTGSKRPDGYLATTVGKKQYLVHRVAFYCMTGRWPKGYVDHIDGNKQNNSWSNLREADVFQSAYNMRGSPLRKSSHKGVCIHKTTGKWRASINAKGKRSHLGLFDSEEDAAEAYRQASLRLQEEFSYFARSAP